jgi:hypothetical protein
MSRTQLMCTATPAAFSRCRRRTAVLDMVARSMVITQASSCPRVQTWAGRPRASCLRYRAGGPFDAAADFVFASPFAPRDAAFAAYARPSFTPGQQPAGRSAPS